MADRRRAELEKKKQKLAMMREEKERRRREREARESEENRHRLERDLRTETDELLSSLGILPPSEVSICWSTASSNSTPDTSLSPTPDQNVTSTGTQAGKRKPKLSIVNVYQDNVPPKENVTYHKQTQTIPCSFDKDVLVLEHYEWDDEFQVPICDGLVEDSEPSPLSHDLDTPTLFANGLSLPKVPGLPNLNSIGQTENLEEKSSALEAINKKSKRCELSEVEKHQIILSENFISFFQRASSIIERALHENVDVCVDYIGIGEETEGDDKSGVKLSLNRYFLDDHWSKNRTVTSLDWSTQFPELLVASYNNNEESPHDPDGVCLVWNMKFKKTTPEYIFHCQSAVMSTCFAKFHPNLIIGGTYSGQIVLWDNRSNKRTPVQRSPLSANAHTHPVYSVQVVGTENAHNLITVSTDGKFRTWSLDMLSFPIDSMELNQQKQSRAVAASCISFPSGDFNNFVVGSEEGILYSACRHGTKPGIMDVFEGHQGPVTSVNMHHVQGQVDFSHLFLTSSIDWTVKLWSLKENKPLYSFEDNGDYIYDVQWSPIHPALFASVDGMGRLDLWNLNNDTELPTVSTIVDGAPALNRLMWAPSGHQIVVGDDIGKIWVYDIGEQLANPKNDEWSQFVQTLQELKNNQLDKNIDMIYTLSSSPSPIR